MVFGNCLDNQDIRLLVRSGCSVCSIVFKLQKSLALSETNDLSQDPALWRSIPADIDSGIIDLPDKNIYSARLSTNWSSTFNPRQQKRSQHVTRLLGLMSFMETVKRLQQVMCSGQARGIIATLDGHLRFGRADKWVYENSQIWKADDIPNPSSESFRILRGVEFETVIKSNGLRLMFVFPRSVR